MGHKYSLTFHTITFSARRGFCPLQRSSYQSYTVFFVLLFSYHHFSNYDILSCRKNVKLSRLCCRLFLIQIMCIHMYQIDVLPFLPIMFERTNSRKRDHSKCSYMEEESRIVTFWVIKYSSGLECNYSMDDVKLHSHCTRRSVMYTDINCHVVTIFVYDYSKPKQQPEKFTLNVPFSTVDWARPKSLT